MRIHEYSLAPDLRTGIALIAECVNEIAVGEELDLKKKVAALAVVARDRAARRA